ncbi:unnamed protein product [Ceutorhynchus assimilis]|uniref:Uncharacterized protein n=1 Tax=Ceutorhynchus assimilis TaxID=467358 RepID=A0A9N9N2D5_9CUCU|nr:unnamed protein product [Ceutorhynchus assimilis]
MDHKEIPSQTPSQAELTQTQQSTSDEIIIDKLQYNVSRDINMILTRNATEQAQSAERDQKLKMQSLRYEHKAVEAQTPTKQEIENALLELQRTEQTLYESVENKNNAMTFFIGTEALVEELDTQVSAFRSRKETALAKSDRFSKNVAKLKLMKLQHIESQKLIQELEMKKQELMCTPEPRIDQNLVEENLAIRKMIEEKKLALEKKRFEKAKMEDHKSKKLLLLIEIYKKGEENQQCEENLKKMEANFNDMAQKWPEQEQEIKTKIAIDEQKLYELGENIQSNEQTIKEVDQKASEIMQGVAEKQLKLTKLDQQLEDRQQDASTTKKQEFDIEKLNQEALNNEIQDIGNKKEELEMKKSDNAATQSNLNDKEAEMVAELLNEKAKLTLHQTKLLEKEDALKTLQMDIETEGSNIEELKSKEINLCKTLEEVKEKQRQFSIDYEQRYNDVSLKHKETLDALLKKMRTAEADIELTQAIVDGGLMELESLVKMNKDYDETIKVEAMKLNNQKRAVKDFEKNKLKPIEDSLKTKKALLKQKNDQKSTGKSKVPSAFDKLAEKTQSLDDQSPIIVIEKEENVENVTGRKSPGILKSPYRIRKPTVPQPTSPNPRRVTFDGIPTSESSSASTNSPKRYRQQSSKINAARKEGSDKRKFTDSF